MRPISTASMSTRSAKGFPRTLSRNLKWPTSKTGANPTMPPMVGSAPTCDSAMTNRRQWTCRKFAIVCLTVFGSLGTLCMAVGILTAGPASAPSDEHASWGTDHVGSPLPDYATGDECLFCHRDRFGADWEKNAHERTVRPAESAPTEIHALKASPATSS